jgi:hypothetical protein
MHSRPDTLTRMRGRGKARSTFFDFSHPKC